MTILTNAEIKAICLANGFKTKPQADGTEDLNPYVYDAVRVAVQEAMRKTVEFKVDLSDFTNAPDEVDNLPSNAQFYYLNELDQLLTVGKNVALQHVEFIDALRALRKFALSESFGGKLCGFEFETLGKRTVAIKHIATDTAIDAVEQWVVGKVVTTQPTLSTAPVIDVEAEFRQALYIDLSQFNRILSQNASPADRQLLLENNTGLLERLAIYFLGHVKEKPFTVSGFIVTRSGPIHSSIVEITHLNTGIKAVRHAQGTGWHFIGMNASIVPAVSIGDVHDLEVLDLLVSVGDVDSFNAQLAKYNDVLDKLWNALENSIARTLICHPFEVTSISRGHANAKQIRHIPTGRISFPSIDGGWSWFIDLDGSKQMYLVLATLEITAADYNPQSGEFDGNPFKLPDWIAEDTEAMTFVTSALSRPERRLTPHTSGGSDYAQWCLSNDTAHSFGPGDYIDILSDGGVILRKSGTIDSEAHQLTEIYAKAFPERPTFTFNRLRANAAILQYALFVITTNRGNVIDSLHALVKRGRVEIGDIPSKVGLADLVALDYAATEDGSTYVATPNGYTLHSVIENLFEEYRRAS